MIIVTFKDGTAKKFESATEVREMGLGESTRGKAMISLIQPQKIIALINGDEIRQIEVM